jgi:hypothetical protein
MSLLTSILATIVGEASPLENRHQLPPKVMNCLSENLRGTIDA